MAIDYDQLPDAAASFIKIITEDKDLNEVKASAYALSSLAGFLAGFAGAKIGDSSAEFLNWCAEAFGKAAGESLKQHRL